VPVSSRARRDRHLQPRLGTPQSTSGPRFPASATGRLSAAPRSLAGRRKSIAHRTQRSNPCRTQLRSPLRVCAILLRDIGLRSVCWRSARIPNLRYSCFASNRRRGHACGSVIGIRLQPPSTPLIAGLSTPGALSRQLHPPINAPSHHRPDSGNSRRGVREKI
jgi:hypothetical protein